jgi:parallel beta-helix repeat protein
LCLAPLPGEAREFYVDPVNGSPAGNGSADRPWRTIQAVFDAGLVESRRWAQLPYTQRSRLVPRNAGAAVRAGDTIRLRSGFHGALAITGYYNSSPITLAAEDGHAPRLSSVRIRAGSHWVIRGLIVSAEFGEPYERRTLVDLDSHGWQGPVHDVTVEDCAIRSVADAAAWTAEDWNQQACNGFQVDGARMTIRGNHLLNVDFGISVGADNSLITDNVIENFAGDGLRGLGDDCTFQYNTVKNCYDVNRNHDDGFQSWSVGPNGVGSGQVVGLVLRGNTIMNYEDPNQPHRGTLQGIGCFDGTFVDWVVENNVVVTDHYHGITLLGARNCLVINNTVLDLNDARPGPPWIRIGNHKKGTPPVDCVVRNNLATAFTNALDVVEESNLRIRDASALFVDPTGFDLHLLPDAAAIDAGSSRHAPRLDRDRIPRPQGAGIDIGAYEWHTDDVLPVENDPADRAPWADDKPVGQSGTRSASMSSW